MLLRHLLLSNYYCDVDFNHTAQVSLTMVQGITDLAHTPLFIPQVATGGAIG